MATILAWRKLWVSDPPSFQEQIVSKNWFVVWVAVSLGLGAGILVCIPTARAKDEPIPTAALADSDIAFLKKGLAKKPKDSEVNTLKATAMMLALYAQNNLTGSDADRKSVV